MGLAVKISAAKVLLSRKFRNYVGFVFGKFRVSYWDFCNYGCLKCLDFPIVAVL